MYSQRKRKRAEREREREIVEKESRERGKEKQTAAQLLKLFDPFREGNNLCWTNKGEIQRVKEENKPFPLIIIQRYGFKVGIVDHGFG
jgi:hypothetical protein